MALTAKQERFAQVVASGRNQSDAYREAYDAANMKPASINVNASKLMADAKVAQRVAELRQPAVERAQMTLDSHLADLERLRDIAERRGQMNAAITAEIARGKASGVHVERTQASITVQTDDDETRAAEIEARLAVKLAQRSAMDATASVSAQKTRVLTEADTSGSVSE